MILVASCDWESRVRRPFHFGKNWYYRSMLSWRAQKQLFIFLILGGVLGGALLFGLYYVVPAASCFDQRRNQGEEDIDCGGPCAPCALKHSKGIVSLWARSFETRAKVYDVAAQIENPNESLSSAEVEYEFTLFDRIGPLAKKTGHTFLFAQERVVVLETNLETVRPPEGVEFKILKVTWKASREPPPDLIAARYEYRVVDGDGGKKSMVEASILNNSPFGFREVEVQFLVLDGTETLIGINKVLVEDLLAGARVTVRSIWPGVLKGEVARISIQPRVNIFDPSMILKPQ